MTESTGPPASKRLAVLGFPVSHSRSPVMQTAALNDLGMTPEWSYEAIEVAPDDFAARVAEMAAGDFVGVNVTVPHKEAALRVSDTAGPAAVQIGAANTLIFEGGSVRAENTDGPGVLDSLPDELPRHRALVLGAGGAARAVVWALAGDGFAVDVWNRTTARATALADELGGEVVISPKAAEYDLVVNASTAGLGGEDAIGSLPVDPGDFRQGQIVIDLVYGTGPSGLLEAARRDGADAVDGLEILVRQGARSFLMWTGREPSLEVMRSAARTS
jgi:shikimate dehydrogenase